MSEKHFDVIIVGAGLSGVGAAVHLKQKCPGKTFAILEGREAIGGTWDIFRYPGIRSDSDMHTLGYNFKPWTAAKAIADGPSIRTYVNDTADEYGIREHIRFQHLVKSCSWSSEDARWTVVAEHAGTGEQVTLTCNFIDMCAGYYSYKEGHSPDFEGREDFKGDIIHPQFWDEAYDYSGKRVVVIGSGATAMTLVPAMADKASHVTMLQRSPTYVVSRPAKDAVANALRKVLPASTAYGVTRWKNTRMQQFLYRRTRTQPEKMKKKLLELAKKQLPDETVDQHFTPTYNPWDQRMCLIPDADLFDALNNGRASVVTGHIERFTENGILLKNGETIEADLIVTATGLKLVLLGEAEITVDGEQVNFADTWTYKGMMYSGVPNLITTFGYINASWTLRADLTAEYLCRVVNHMSDTGTRQATPVLGESDKNMPPRDWIDDFSSGYMRRSMHLFPKQGDREPWMNPQNFHKDKKMIREAPLDDGALIFSNSETAPKVKAAGAESMLAAE